MAKWGEGDPRWIVEERPDATNVNNWHWTEKNATAWSKDKLRELLVGLVVEDSEVFCELKDLTKLEGEASANNRKAKLIFFYEWVIKGEWSGKLKSKDKKHKGKYEILNLSEENEPDEIDIEFTVDNMTDESRKIKEVLRKQGTQLIQQQLAKYIKGLKEEYSHDIIKPTKDNADVLKSQTDKNIMNSAKTEMNKLVITKGKAEGVGVKIQTKKLVGKEEFKCRATDFYRALTDKEVVQAFTGSPAEMEVEKGGRFSLMHGYVSGEFVELVPDKKIVQRWRVKTWPEAHYSEVTFDLEEKEDCTVLHLTQSGIPSTEFERTKEGWKINYWGRMKQILGFGSSLL